MRRFVHSARGAGVAAARRGRHRPTPRPRSGCRTGSPTGSARWTPPGPNGCGRPSTQLRADGTDLFVVYVDSFDGADGQQWASDTANLSQFGTNDVLLAVAVEDRTYGYSFADDYPLPESTTDEIVARDVEPRLAADDWAGAAVALADGLREGGSDTGGAGAGVGTIAVVGGLVVVGGGAYLISRRRRRAARRPDAGIRRPDPGPGADGRVQRRRHRGARVPGQLRADRGGRRGTHLRAGAQRRPRTLRRRGGGRVHRGPGAVPRGHGRGIRDPAAAGRRGAGGRADQARHVRRHHPRLPHGRRSARRPGGGLRPAARPGGHGAGVPDRAGHPAGGAHRAGTADRAGLGRPARPLRRRRGGADEPTTWSRPGGCSGWRGPSWPTRAPISPARDRPPRWCPGAPRRTRSPRPRPCSTGCRGWPASWPTRRPASQRPGPN